MVNLDFFNPSSPRGEANIPSCSPSHRAAVYTHQPPSMPPPTISIRQYRPTSQCLTSLTEPYILLMAASSWNSCEPLSMFPLSRYPMDYITETPSQYIIGSELIVHVHVHVHGTSVTY